MMNEKIALLARSLDIGGAERQLVELAKGLTRAGCEVAVITFYPGGTLESELSSQTIPLYSLYKKGRWDIVLFFIRLCKLLRALRVTHLYAFLGVPCIIAAMTRCFFQQLHIIWGVRASNMDLRRYDWPTRIAYLIECLLSRFAHVIIANSTAGRDYAVANGFPRDKIRIIPNGIDIDRYRPDGRLRSPLRTEWGITEPEVLIGIVARLDPMKDHPTFFSAARQVLAARPLARFVCVGEGGQAVEGHLKQIAHNIGLGDELIWAGARSDMPAVYNALDILVSSSITEGFPNVIAEAMACGIPCVATDVGDTRLLVAESGSLVCPGDADALATKIITMVDRVASQEIDSFGIRQRIVAHFGSTTMVNRTIQALNG